jgi:hypothetical protein
MNDYSLRRLNCVDTIMLLEHMLIITLQRDAFQKCDNQNDFSRSESYYTDKCR